MLCFFFLKNQNFQIWALPLSPTLACRKEVGPVHKPSLTDDLGSGFLAPFTNFLPLSSNGDSIIYYLSKGLSVFPKNDLFSSWKSGPGTELLAFTSVLYSLGNQVFMNLDNFAGKALTKRGLISCSCPRPQVGGDSFADRAHTASVNEEVFLICILPEPRSQNWVKKME